MSAAAVPAAPAPLFFGPEDGLFGVYHPPDAVPRRAAAIVLCYPAGHEYLRVQRSFRNAAAALARLGFPVMRFDYSGTGDSAGEGSDRDLAAWTRDLAAAIAEVKRRSGARRVALAGLRLGGSIAWLEASARDDVDALVAWDPVVDGQSYVEDLLALEQRWLADSSRVRTARRTPGTLLGFPFGDALDGGLRALELGAHLPRTRLTFVVDSIDRPDRQAWRARIRELYGVRSCAIVPAFTDWDAADAIHTAVYPAQFSQALASVFGSLVR
jgi:alpha/beta superfamily hydrolase